MCWWGGGTWRRSQHRDACQSRRREQPHATHVIKRTHDMGSGTKCSEGVACWGACDATGGLVGQLVGAIRLLDFAVGLRDPDSFRLTPVTALPPRSFCLPVRLRYLRWARLSEVAFARALGRLIGVSLGVCPHEGHQGCRILRCGVDSHDSIDENISIKEESVQETSVCALVPKSCCYVAIGLIVGVRHKEINLKPRNVPR